MSQPYCPASVITDPAFAPLPTPVAEGTQASLVGAIATVTGIKPDDAVARKRRACYRCKWLQ